MPPKLNRPETVQSRDFPFQVFCCSEVTRSLLKVPSLKPRLGGRKARCPELRYWQRNGTSPALTLWHNLPGNERSRTWSA
nr:MAG TPA: hypothetical protein [Caudoviricetes sp.]